ncbi:mediator of RNA polymerase II transcription subunit 22 isoform X2 [Hyla sarda]|uniref:mediator of RNA polymerase II transcription subunit 22 isoform X2 n=1 Tax=Hyla sarda TaxID=327740 RepID=UPI0024C3C69A|nr:mediator of RNA polymerase II transcription subunit 22 isoform X2 [Hyla sarda]
MEPDRPDREETTHHGGQEERKEGEGIVGNICMRAEISRYLASGNETCDCGYELSEYGAAPPTGSEKLLLLVVLFLRASQSPRTSSGKSCREKAVMAQQRVLPQSKETLLQSYNKRLKDDIKSIMDNFTEIIKTARIEEEHQVSRSTQGEQDNYEMHVRSANIVRAGESLMRLVSDLKQYLILNDFPSVNEGINQRNQQLRMLQDECDKKLISLRDEVAIDLYELEEEYYSSSVCEPSDLPLCEAYWIRDSLDFSPQDPSIPMTSVTSENSSIPSQISASPHLNGHGVSLSEHS